MKNCLDGKEIQLKWIGAQPGNNKKTAMLIPQFNESSQCDFELRLRYFDKLGEKYKEKLDIIIIDDCSTDKSLEKIITYRNKNQENFYIASVYPNGNKVGALSITSNAIFHEFIILSDFDTDLSGVEELISKTTAKLKEDPSLMGYYFRMLPHEGTGTVFLFQQIEYTLQRILYRFHQNERTIRVMPGAGSCFKREILNLIYNQHSGLRNGEDREATTIGLKLGYRTTYQDKVLALTRPPLTFKNLVKQRIRWNLGYLETLTKESRYYFSELIHLSRIGIVTLFDIVLVSFIVLFPVLTTLIGFISFKGLLIFLASLYLINILWCINLIVLSPQECKEFEAKKIYSVLLFPLVKLPLDYLAWTGAIYKMLKNKPGKKDKKMFLKKDAEIFVQN